MNIADQYKIKSFFKIVLVLNLILAFPSNSIAAVMSSSNYQIISDSVNAFGNQSDSDSYTMDDAAGELIAGPGESTSYSANQGYPVDGDKFLSLNCPSLVTMTPITGTGQSNLSSNSAVCNIKTDSTTGYTISWQASNTDMANGQGDKINAYTPVTTNVPEIWSITNTDSEWGARLGASSTTKDTDRWGTVDTYAGGKWLNVSTSLTELISRNDQTDLTGDNEVIMFGAEIGSNKFQPSGTYSVNVTITASIQ